MSSTRLSNGLFVLLFVFRVLIFFFFFQAEDGIRDGTVTGVQTCALPILNPGGVRIGTAEIYRQVEKLDEVAESLVIGQDWPPGQYGDVRVVLFVRLKEGDRKSVV